MALTKEKKSRVSKKFGKKESDTGSSEVQIAILTEEINTLTEHLKFISMIIMPSVVY